MPTTPDAYTHRIGRTGRSERQGRAYTFVTPEDHQMVRAVERRMGAAIPQQVFDGLGGATVCKASGPERRPAPARRQAKGPARRRRNRTAVRRKHKPTTEAGAVRANSVK